MRVSAPWGAMIWSPMGRWSAVKPQWMLAAGMVGAFIIIVRVYRGCCRLAVGVVGDLSSSLGVYGVFCGFVVGVGGGGRWRFIIIARGV